MIQKVNITKSYIDDQEEFLKKFQETVKNGLMAPIGLRLDNTPEIKLRFNIIVKTIVDTFKDVDPVLVLPGTLIQVLFSKKELLVTILFMENSKTNEKMIHMELCKLSSDDLSNDASGSLHI